MTVLCEGAGADPRLSFGGGGSANPEVCYGRGPGPA